VTIVASSMILTSHRAHVVVGMAASLGQNAAPGSRSRASDHLVDSGSTVLAMSGEQHATEIGLPMTAEELMQLPEHGQGCDLVDGELPEVPPSEGEDGHVAGEVAGRIAAYLTEHPAVRGDLFAAGTGFLLRRNPDIVRAPDVAFVAGDRLPLARVPSFPQLAPDLVVEVVSPTDAASAIHEKVNQWLRAGTRLVWVLYPESQTAMVYQPDGSARLLRADATLDGEPVLPGFTCRLDDLFGA
jgi:Uma2 family endonuclease